MTLIDLLSPQVIGSLFGGGAIGAIVVALINGRFGLAAKSRETEASIQEVWTRSTAELIKQYTEALNRAEAEMTEMRAEVSELLRRVEEQRRQITRLEEASDRQTAEIAAMVEELAKHGVSWPKRRRRAAEANTMLTPADAMGSTDEA